MISKRHLAREIALQSLYRFEMTWPKDMGFDRETLSQEIKNHFAHFLIPEDSGDFAFELIIGTLMQTQEIDEVIKNTAKNWRIERIATLDRCLLRLAIYEIKNQLDIPIKVTLDEAIELGKQFGSAESAGFINGILDQVAKTYKRL